MTILDFTRSRLFRELGLPKDQFAIVFDHPSAMVIRKDNLAYLLRRCDFFMMEPFEEFYPWRHQIRSLPSDVPLIRECKLVFFADQKEIVRTLDLHLIRWVHTHRGIFTSDVYLYLMDSIKIEKEMDAMEMMEFFYQHKIFPAHHVLRVAFRRGLLRLAEWLWTHGCPLTSHDISVVLEVSGSTLDTSYISRMIRDGCPIHSHTVASAASKGRLDFVEWWHEQGYPFCDSAAAWAALWGHVEIIRFLMDHDKPINRKWTLSNASRNNQLGVIRLLRTIQ